MKISSSTSPVALTASSTLPAAAPTDLRSSVGPTVGQGLPTREDIKRRLVAGERTQEFYVRWEAAVGGRILSTPGVGADGSLALINDEALVVLGPDGKQRFSVPQPEEGPFCQFWSPVFTADGGVLVPGTDGLHCFDAAGQPRWHQPIGEMRTPPEVDGQGRVYAAGAGGKVHCFDADGKSQWAYDLTPHLREEYRLERQEWAESLRQDLKKPDLEPKFRKDLETWLKEAEAQVASPDAGYTGVPKITGGPNVGPDGKIRCFTEVGPLFCLNPDGTMDSTIHPSGWLQSDGVSFTPEGGVLAVTGNSLLEAWRPDGSLEFEYSGNAERRLDQMGAADQAEARKCGNVCASTTPCLSPDGKAIYFAGMDGKVRAVDRAGNKLWTRELRGATISSMDVAVGSDGNVYGVNSKGLTAFTPDGRALWSYETDSKYVFVAVEGKHVYLTTYGGKVLDLDVDYYREMADAAFKSPGVSEPARIQVGDGVVTIGGVTLPQRG